MIKNWKGCLIASLLVMPRLAAADSEIALHRIQNQLFLRNWPEAIREAEEASQIFPQNAALHAAYVKALAKGGELRKACQAWREHFERYSLDEALLEELCFCLLESASQSSSLQTRLFALVGSVLSQDIRGVRVLDEALKSSNAHLRRVAVDLSAYLPDKGLRRQLIHMLSGERQMDMRVAIIRSLGAQRAEESRRALFELVSRSNRAEERGAAAESLARIYEDYPPGDLQVLVESDRTSLRWLGCRLIAHLEMESLLPSLRDRIHDSQVDVRVAAWEALGSLREAKEPIDPDEHPRVRMAAAWARGLSGESAGAQDLIHFVAGGNADLAREAGARLAALGAQGAPLWVEALGLTQDPLIRLNLALALIRHDVHLDIASKTLFDGLENCKERLCWNQEVWGDWVAVQNRQLYLPGTAIAEDHFLRLRLLNLLVMAEHKEAKEQVRRFLRHRRFPLMGEAAMSLLAEGESMEDLHDLLLEEDPQLRLRMALILALWARDEEALDVLVDAYPDADRQMKESILEVMGRVGGRGRVEFLQKSLDEPFQNLRVLAAASIVQVLNH